MIGFLSYQPKKSGVIDMPPFSNEKTNYAKGVDAEGQAALYLEERGFQILSRRYKTKFGEIDLVIKKGNLICFVEVKRRASLEEALASITPRNRQRIEQSALYFGVDFPEYAACDLRFDVIAITGDGRITHLDNAWLAGA